MAAIDQNLIAICRTIYGTALQTNKTLDLPFELVTNTTLNELFNVQSGVSPNPNQMPAMKYLAIGNRGHTFSTAEDGSAETVPLAHRATDAACFNHIPFVLRETNNDLTADKRDRYALRVEEVHNGRNYFAYYLRRLDLSQVVTQLQRVTVENGIVTTTPFQPTNDNLHPTPPNVSNTGTVLGSSTYETASAVVTIELDAEDIQEILNAHVVRTGRTTTSPVLSELALCSGVDKAVQGSSASGGTFTYNEAIAVQVNVFVSTMHPVGYSTDGATITLDVGGVEPHLGEEDVNNATFLNGA